MIQTDYCPDKFGTYLSHPDCKVFIVRNTEELWRESGICSFFYSPYTSSVSNYDRYLHSLLKEIGEEFNDTVITEVKVGGVVNRGEKMLRSQICQDIRTVLFL